MQSGRAILLVESPAADLSAARRALEDLGIGDRVICSATAPEALVHLKAQDGQKPSVVLVSVDESSEEGLATLRTIKGDDQLKTIPVVVLGPSGDGRMIDESFALGAAGYMARSPDHREFSAAIRTLYEYWSLSELPR